MNQRFSRVIRHQAIIPSITAVVGTGAGLAVGFFLGRRKASQILNEYARSGVIAHPMMSDRGKVERPDINPEAFDLYNPEAFDLYPHLQDRSIDDHREPVMAPPVPTHPGDQLSAAEEFIRQQMINKRMEPVEPPEVEVVHHSVFGEDPDWDYTEQLATRSPDRPYVIHKDEFHAEESGFPQVTLTYFEGDDILVDEDETPIYNHEDITGPMLFGLGSGDPNVFHVRNEKRRGEYEIIRAEGCYSKEVLGLEIDTNERVRGLKHSADNVRRFREE